MASSTDVADNTADNTIQMNMLCLANLKHMHVQRHDQTHDEPDVRAWPEVDLILQFEVSCSMPDRSSCNLQGTMSAAMNSTMVPESPFLETKAAITTCKLATSRLLA